MGMGRWDSLLSAEAPAKRAGKMGVTGETGGKRRDLTNTDPLSPNARGRVHRAAKV